MFNRNFIRNVIAKFNCRAANAALLMFLFLAFGGAAARAATFTVNLTTDANDVNVGDGICDSNSVALGIQCTLRAALQEANFAPAVDNVAFSLGAANAINLTLGSLSVTSSLNINGPGARLLTVRRAPAAPDFGVFNAQGPNITINISGITISGGKMSNIVGAGGIENHGPLLTLNGVAVKNNTSNFGGGGIRNEGGGVNIINSTISNNTARQGGGINNLNDAFPVRIINSTISDNTAYKDAAAIPALGGGIFNTGEIILVNSTISNNTSHDLGGGIYALGASFDTKVRNTIIAANTAPANSDVYGAAESQGNNLIGIAESDSGFTNGAGGDKVGFPAAPLNARLDALKDNGGQTDTRALLAGSAAIDAGNSCVAENPFCLAPALTTDQRSLPRKFGASVDIGAYEAQSNQVFVNKTPGDFDGDGRADVAVFRPSNGTWYISRSSNAQMQAAQFGVNGDRPATGDFDGDNKADYAVFRPSSGTWYILQSLNNQFRAAQFGTNGDVPTPADYDADGKTDVAVFRPANGAWYVLRSSNNQFQAAQFGQSGDVPQAADFDKDGKADYAVFRESSGTWYVLGTSAGFKAAQLGMNGDIAQAADFDGDAAADYAVFRPSNGTWYVFRSGDNQLQSAWFGQTGDVPAVRDYNGDGRADYAVFRPSNGTWYIARPTGAPAQNFDAIRFGANGDAPSN